MGLSTGGDAAWMDRDLGGSRDEMLEHLAQWMDAREGALGPGGETAATEQGKQVRMLKMDRLTLSFPEVVAINDEAFLKRDQSVPATFAEQSTQYRFLWVRLAVGLFPQAGWAFNRLEAQADFSAIGAESLQPRVIHILPKPEFETLAQATMSLNVSVAPSMELKVEPTSVEVPPGKLEVALNVGSTGSAGVAFGPRAYRAVRAKVEHNPPGNEWVHWRLSDARLYAETTPELAVIVQVPRAAGGLTVACAIQARRYFRLWTADYQDAVKHLPAAIQGFFRGGVPTEPVEGTFDLSSALTSG